LLLDFGFEFVLKETEMSRKKYTPEAIIGMLREAEIHLRQGQTASSIAHFH